MNPSRLVRSFSRRTFFQSLFFSVVLAGIATLFLWYARDVAAPLIKFNAMDIGLLFIFLIAFGILQWMFQRSTLTKLAAILGTPALKRDKAPRGATPPTDADRALLRNRERRLFVHLFAVLQREGRLMDFLQEDLAMYEDRQIGAAVRDVHANCKKALLRYLKPEPVMTQPEGETVEVGKDFDPQAVKLVGNVVGEPPFSGILRHRGWQLRQVVVPELADSERPEIIAPAEIDVQ